MTQTIRQRRALHRLCPEHLARIEREYYAAMDHRPRHPYAACVMVIIIVIAACALLACVAPSAGA